MQINIYTRISDSTVIARTSTWSVSVLCLEKTVCSTYCYLHLLVIFVNCRIKLLLWTKCWFTVHKIVGSGLGQQTVSQTKLVNCMQLVWKWMSFTLNNWFPFLSPTALDNKVWTSCFTAKICFFPPLLLTIQAKVYQSCLLIPDDEKNTYHIH